MASLPESGRQTPIVVLAAEGQTDRYVVIDGYKRSRRWSYSAGTRRGGVVDERNGGSAPSRLLDAGAREVS